MTEYDGERPDEKYQTTCNKGIVYGGDNATYYTGQTYYAQTWHQALNRWEMFALGIGVVEKTSNSNRNNRYYENI